jgi:Tfp pilus assembly protein PilV
MARPAAAARGVSLVEAVVALAVMAFGLLAFAGLQSTLRFNGDVAKQRAEAVRIAQAAIEQWRAYAVVDADAALPSYAAVAASGAESIADETTNTSFTLARSVVDETIVEGANVPGEPRRKTAIAEVTWTDRHGDTQSVRLTATIAASPPELAGTLSVPDAGVTGRLPRARSPAIPTPARDLGDGTSAFKPPASGGLVAWVFDNLSGVIVGVCTNVATGQESLTATDVASCSNNTLGLPLSGYVRFATGTTQPTAADAENPTGIALNLAVAIELGSTGHPTPAYQCYADAPLSAATAATAVSYYCAIFFTVGGTPTWTGTSSLLPLAYADPVGSLPWTIAANTADANPAHYKVCRYTPATSDAQAVPNRLHPRTYVNVTPLEALRDQNFLVIRAGDGTTTFQCPTDVAADPSAGDLVNSNTLLHQPAPTAP